MYGLGWECAKSLGSFEEISRDRFFSFGVFFQSFVCWLLNEVSSYSCSKLFSVGDGG